MYVVSMDHTTLNGRSIIQTLLSSFMYSFLPLFHTFLFIFISYSSLFSLLSDLHSILRTSFSLLPFSFMSSSFLYVFFLSFVVPSPSFHSTFPILSSFFFLTYKRASCEAASCLHALSTSVCATTMHCNRLLCFKQRKNNYGRIWSCSDVLLT